MKNYNINKTRIIIATLVSAYFIYYILTATDWHFIDNINLIFHEAGHSIFFFLGEFIQVLAGSLFQVIFPLVFGYYFYYDHDYFSASLILFWVGQNLLNVSIYASDAVVMQLPLLGGDSSIHDWNYLLENLGWLNQTDKIGAGIFHLGVMVIILAIILSYYHSISKNN